MGEPPAAYPIVAWDATTVLVGTLHGADAELVAVPTGGRFRDIRGCSAPAVGDWAAVAAVDAATGVHGLWWLDLRGGTAERLVDADYLLHAAVDRTGVAVAYTALPHRTRDDISLHVLTVATRRTTLLVAGSVARSAVPSWRSADRILVHTEGTEVAEVDVGSGAVRRLFPGEYPVAAPDGNRLAYREGRAVRIIGTEGEQADVTPRQVFPRPLRGAMSWSPDGRLLLLGRTGGALGYEIVFGTVDVSTRRFTRIRRRYLQGIVFR